MILLDTHVLLWERFGYGNLGRRTRGVIERAVQDGDIAVSAISFWEVAMLHDKRRLTLLRDVASWRESLLRDGLLEIPVDGAIATRAGFLRDLSGEPADRVIVATALEGHRLVTADQHILDWPGALSRLDATE